MDGQQMAHVRTTLVTWALLAVKRFGKLLKYGTLARIGDHLIIARLAYLITLHAIYMIRPLLSWNLYSPRA